MPLELCRVRPGEDGIGGELAPVVADDRLRPAALGHQAIQLPGHPHAGQSTVCARQGAVLGTSGRRGFAASSDKGSGAWTLPARSTSTSASIASCGSRCMMNQACAASASSRSASSCMTSWLKSMAARSRRGSFRPGAIDEECLYKLEQGSTAAGLSGQSWEACTIPLPSRCWTAYPSMQRRASV